MSRHDPFIIFGTSEPIHNKTVARYAESRWLGDEFAPERSTPVQGGLSVPSNRYRWLIIGIGFIFVLIVTRLISLQIVTGAEYRERAEFNRLKRQVIPAPRGLIFDRHGTSLVENVPDFAVLLDADSLSNKKEERAEQLQTIAQTTALPLETIEQLMDVAPDPSAVTIKEGLGYDESRRLRVQLAKLPFVSLALRPLRHYLEAETFAHVIGYLGQISASELAERDGYLRTATIGKDGLEKQYEGYLKGINGWAQIERDSRNNEQRVIASVEAVPGNSLHVTLDAEVQRSLDEALRQTVEQNRNATGGVAVAIDPRDGAIVALVSYPAYDSNRLYQPDGTDYVQSLFADEQSPLFNRAVAAQYAPGSTFKPVVAAAALEEGVISEHTTVVSTGGIKINQWFFPDWKAGGHGVTDVRRALAESINTFFYTIGGGYDRFKGLGVERLTRFARSFGFGQPLGLDLTNEANGFLPSQAWKEEVKKESWYIGDTYHYAIGQGDVLVTPLQIASATATIANGGTRFIPYLLRQITAPSGEVVFDHSLNAGETVISSATARIVGEGMRQGVTSGSSVALASFPVAVAGKTGTAQTPQQTTHAWFTGYAPYHSPELVVTVVVENGGEGHAVALPIARAGLAAYFNQ